MAPSTINIVRLDDGVRAKAVCEKCGAETYIPILIDGQPTNIETVIQALRNAILGHIEWCS